MEGPKVKVKSHGEMEKFFVMFYVKTAGYIASEEAKCWNHYSAIFENGLEAAFEYLSLPSGL